MNIFTAIRNAFAAPVEAPPPAPVAGPPVGAVISGPPASETGDSFQKHFAGPPYFQRAVLRPSGFFVDRPPTLTAAIWQTVFDRAGGDRIVSDSDRQKLRELKASQDAIIAKLNEVTFWSASKMLREAKAAAMPKILAGELPHVPGYKESLDSIITIREGLHQAQRELSGRIFELVKPICDKMKNAARELAKELDEAERQEHSEFYGSAAPFTPSPQLTAFVYVGLGAWEIPIRNFKLTGLLTAPDPANLLAAWFNPAAPAKPALPLGRQRDASRRELEDGAVKTARAAEREKANRVVKAVKDKVAANEASEDLRRAKVKLDREAREKIALEAAKKEAES